MPRETEDREDLLRDATAYVTRVQLKFASDATLVEVFAGFRVQGAASFYFDQDPVYHFNSAGQLRRAFVDDVLIKAESGQLVEWRRQRTDTTVTMLRQEMSAEQQHKFCETAVRQLGGLRQSIAQGSIVLEGQIPAGEDVVVRLAAYLERCETIEIADSPHVGS